MDPRWPRLAGQVLALSVLTGVVSAQVADTARTVAAAIDIQPLVHGTLRIVSGQHVILVDPARFVPTQPEVPRADLQALAAAYLAKFGTPPAPTPPDREPLPELLVSAAPVRPEQMTKLVSATPPTLILITHTHTDHLDPRAIAAVRRPETRLIVPTSAKDMLLDVAAAETMANGTRLELGDLVIEAVPMYNVDPDPTSGTVLHPKGRGNGYVISIGGTRLYVAGDTGCTPEMMALRDIDVAFVPMNLPYTMSPEQAATCVKAMKPRVVYPYHYFESDPLVFEKALQGSGIEVRVRDWYPAAKSSTK